MEDISASKAEGATNVLTLFSGQCDSIVSHFSHQNALKFCFEKGEEVRPEAVTVNAFARMLEASKRQEEGLAYLCAHNFPDVRRKGPKMCWDALCSVFQREQMQVLEASSSIAISTIVSVAVVLWKLDRHWGVLFQRSKGLCKRDWLEKVGLISAKEPLYCTDEYLMQQKKGRKERLNKEKLRNVSLVVFRVIHYEMALVSGVI
jgi:hypothetical protein